MVDTSKRIPAKLRREARELWGYTCAMCGTKARTDLAHTSHDGTNSYKDTKAYNLPPLCHSCHRKSDTLHWDSPFQITLRWIVKKKAELTEKALEEFLEERLSQIEQSYRMPLGSEKEALENIFGMGEHWQSSIDTYFKENKEKEE